MTTQMFTATDIISDAEFKKGNDFWRLGWSDDDVLFGIKRYRAISSVTGEYLFAEALTPKAFAKILNDQNFEKM